MSDETTRDMPRADGRSFEERVFARFDAIESRLGALEEQNERRAMETKPIWERALKEIMDTKKEIMDTRRELSKRLDRIESVTLDNRADLRELEERVERLEPKPTR